jgi:hypothetical protein
MNKIDFEKTKCDFDNGTTKWYKEPDLQKYIQTQQKENLPSLKGMGCFAVKGVSSTGEDVEDLVLINHHQQILANYPYTPSGYEQMEARINIIKVSQHFNSYESNDI